jgi:hypothetical protein
MNIFVLYTILIVILIVNVRVLIRIRETLTTGVNYLRIQTVLLNEIASKQDINTNIVGLDKKAKKNDIWYNEILKS